MTSLKEDQDAARSQPVVAPKRAIGEAGLSAAELHRRLLRHRLHMGDLGAGPMRDALAALDTLVTYGRWQIGPESLSHHPTLPSAIASAQASLDRALALLFSEEQPLRAEGTDAAPLPGTSPENPSPNPPGVSS